MCALCFGAVEIRHCAQLVEVSLEGNRLATPVLDLRSLGRLRSLQLFANPLEFLPELSPCTSLRHLSLANVSCFVALGSPQKPHGWACLYEIHIWPHRTVPWAGSTAVWHWKASAPSHGS